MKDIIHFHIPFQVFKQRTDEIIKAGLNPELFFDSAALDSVREEELISINRALKGRAVTMHGPYMELSPGSPDEKVRGVTIERYTQALWVSRYLKPKSIVLHAGYDEKRFDGNVELWLNESLKTWPELIKEAEKLNMVIAVENVFEENPMPIKRLLDKIPSDSFRMCLDSGHLNIFSKVSLEEWFEAIGDKIFEVHLHDNFGKKDEHLPIGEGTLDRQGFFSLLKRYSRPIVYTLEIHNEEALKRGLNAAEKFPL